MTILNIPTYNNHLKETKIALLDNSTISFLEQLGIITKNLFIDYDAIFIPNWVSKEINNSVYRKRYIENLYDENLPLFLISEENYSSLVNYEEGNLYQIVLASVSMLAPLKSYLRKNVEKLDPLDMEEYSIWINRMYNNWPLSTNEIIKKNAGEISLTILAEILSWYYPTIESITIYTQDRDCFDYQKNAHKLLKKIFKNKNPIDISFKSNDFLLWQMYKYKMITLDKIKEIRKDERTIIYTQKREDSSIVLTSAKLDNAKFIKLLENNNIQIIF